jgi:hypothetical protein
MVVSMAKKLDKVSIDTIINAAAIAKRAVRQIA